MPETEDRSSFGSLNGENAKQRDSGHKSYGGGGGEREIKGKS